MKEFLQHQTIDAAVIDAIPSISDAILLSLSDVQDPELIEAMALKFDLQEPIDGFCKVFQKNVYLAHKILKHYEADIAADTTYDSFDNEPDMHHYAFQPDSLLDRYYTSLQYNNSLDCLTDVLLNTCISSRLPNHLMVIENILLENPHSHNHAIQFFVERYYDLEAEEADGGANAYYGGHLKSAVEPILTTLIKSGVDFHSDTQGYLLQFSFMNDKMMLDEIVAAGSSVAGFLARFNNDAMWLTEKQSMQLEEHDINNDRTYNIYKKFDYTQFIQSPQERIALSATFEQMLLKQSVHESSSFKSVIKI